MTFVYDTFHKNYADGEVRLNWLINIDEQGPVPFFNKIIHIYYFRHPTDNTEHQYPLKVEPFYIMAMHCCSRLCLAIEYNTTYYVPRFEKGSK